ncbi:MAG: YggT family protein [Thermoleophilia bacterium]|nr:YggT family protein [Thermoleophilia bacterium]MDH3724138.1 YggT family protein [Thermoleophilia bacterium]
MDTIASYVDALFLVFIVLIFVRILLSWFPSVPQGGALRSVYDFIIQSTEWYLSLFRRFIPPIGMFDISPIAAIFVLFILRSVFSNILGG